MFYLLVGTDPPPITVLHPKSENMCINAQLDRIIAHCTELDTGRRYESASQLVRDLKELGRFIDSTK